MKQYRKLIFVCAENTCRSIMAETIFRSIQKDLPIQVCSRGLVVLFPEPMNPKAIAVLKSHQMECEKSFSEPLSPEDIVEDTLILTMTEREVVAVKENLKEEYDVSTIRAFTGQKGDVPEPHGALTEYGVLYEHIDLLVKMIAEILIKESKE